MPINFHRTSKRARIGPAASPGYDNQGEHQRRLSVAARMQSGEIAGMKHMCTLSVAERKPTAARRAPSSRESRPTVLARIKNTTGAPALPAQYLAASHIAGRW